MKSIQPSPISSASVKTNKIYINSLKKETNNEIHKASVRYTYTNIYFYKAKYPHTIDALSQHTFPIWKQVQVLL